MFDDIIVPKSYLKDILDKKDESLFDTYHKFQTKDLENNLAAYKIYRNQLYKQVPSKAKPTWDKTTTTAEINFYSKELIDKIITNKESREAIDRMWDMEQAVFEEYRQKWSYKFWTRVERFCQKLTVMARNRHSIPYSLRETAYKTSGRLKKDPDCLKLYIDN